MKRLSVEDCLAAIRSHTHGLAAAAEGNFEKRIEHCPDWSMADLVWHLTSVHWFWNEIAHHKPVTEPDLVRPERPADPELIPALLTGVAVLVDTLRAADQNAPCWTWGQEESVWFITRHQVQEAAVHHWDATNAAGLGWQMDPVVAADAVSEFLTHSVANPRWPMPDAEPLGVPVRITMESTVATIVDGAVAGTLDHTVAESSIPGNAAADALLWLYRRVPDDRINLEPSEAVSRFRALTFTD